MDADDLRQDMVEAQGVALNPNMLMEMTETLRERLQHTPEDTPLRLELAWCLFLFSAYQAGREDRADALTRSTGLRRRGASVPAASSLLAQALKDAATVAHLSYGAARAEAEKIKSLARAAGAASAVAEADASLTRALGRLAHQL